MNKELQDLACSCLPKEFREEVKRMWSVEVDCATKYKSELHKHRTGLLYELFGEHLHWQNNLTSDAEGEDEMLYVSRKKLQYFYEKLRKVGENHAAFALQSLFGSKCLPDEKVPNPTPLAEPKPAEPKFKVGDTTSYVCSPTLKHKCTVSKVMQNEHSGRWEYNVMFEWGKPGMWISESDLEPYAEPEDNKAEEIADKALKPVEKHFDTILKDGFSKERRLNIAAMAMQGILAAGEDYTGDCKFIAMKSLELSDALIAEAEKGGANG